MYVHEKGMQKSSSKLGAIALLKQQLFEPKPQERRYLHEEKHSSDFGIHLF
jgi:hypothetical protein